MNDCYKGIYGRYKVDAMNGSMNKHEAAYLARSEYRAALLNDAILSMKNAGELDAIKETLRVQGITVV